MATPLAKPPAGLKSVVMPLAKGFRVLEVFDAPYRELTLPEIAARAGLDAGTTFRLVKTLVMPGYLEGADPAKRRRLGLKVPDPGFNAIARMDLHTASRPILRSLIGPVNEAASIAALDGADMVSIERVQAGLARLGVTQRVGSRIPAYRTAMGYAVPAQLPLEQRVKVLNLREPIKLTPNTPVVVPEIERRLEYVREHGYALSDQDSVLGVRGIAAPILDPVGHPWASVSTATPAAVRPLAGFVQHSAQRVIEAARSLERVLRISGAIAVRVES